MAHLFPENALREQAARIPTTDVAHHIETVERWRDDYRNGTLRNDKETSREQAYNQQFFIDILGHSSRPHEFPTFVPKETTSAGQLPDAVIAVFDGGIPPQSVSAVVELKGARIDLDRPQRREGHLSPVQQAFKYKVQYRQCPFVIVSNYWEFRLYSDDILDYEVWTLDDLCDPEGDYIKFKTWYHLLRRENFVGSPAFPTQRFLSDIRIEHEKIGKQFYVRYKQVRLEFLRQIWRDNGQVRRDIDLAIRVTQKVMDRVVFAAFAEDTGLLPDNTLARLQKQADDAPFKVPLWDTLRHFFDAVDKGDSRLGIPIGYNGGLFAPDPELDQLKIDDDRLRDVLALSKFNFADELTVTVLGHILEQSITDLEEIRSKVIELDGIDDLVESQRKKEGIYYTPDHIVRYIVDNSLGRYLREQEQKCKAGAGLLTSRKLKEETYEARERQAYHAYQSILQQVTVLDPACGSGAFLVGALEFLLAENQRVGAILGGTIFDLSEFAQKTLRDNLYGVDLNAEGVEITKLSLWLKTAQKGHILSDLDSNIRVGNSLIDDAEEAGAKAFDWNLAFPNIKPVDDRGGFDVVIGNPPYVDSESMSRNDPEQRKWLAARYAAAKGNWDLYVVFLDHALRLVKHDGFVSMIVPNKVLSAPYAATLRRLVDDEHRLIGITDVTRDGVFDVDVYPVILAIAADHETKRELSVQEGITDRESLDVLVGDDLPDNWGLLLPSAELVHFTVPTVALSEWFDTWAAATVSEAYALVDMLSENAIANDGKVINTGTIDPYLPLWGFEPMKYLKASYNFPTVCVEQMPKRKPWYGQNKVILNGMGTALEALHSVSDTYLPAKSTVVVTLRENSPLSLYGLTALLNSSYLSYLFEQENRQNAMAGGYMTITQERIGALRLPVAASQQDEELGQISTQLEDDWRELSDQTLRFRHAVRSLGIDRWAKKLSRWWEYSVSEFVQILKPGKLTAETRFELIELFTVAATRAIGVKQRIDKANAEVERIVNDLYELPVSGS